MGLLNDLSSTSKSNAALLPALIVLGILLLRVAYRCTLHPLARIPGPLLARVSDLWLLKLDLTGQGSRIIFDLHKKHGPVVRIGPDELSFDGVSAYNDIYGQKSKMPKSERWYYGILPKEIVNIFTITDKEVHSVLRRLFSNAFSRSNILNFQPTIQEYVALSMEQIRRHIAFNKPVPLYMLATSYTLDAISKISFGENVGALQRPDLDDPIFFNVQRLTRGLTPLLRIHFPIVNRLNTNVVSGIGDFLQVISRCVQKAEQDKDNNCLVRDAARRAKEADYDLSTKEQVTTSLQLVVAGMGTTALSLSGTLLYMLQDPDVYKRAHEELKAVWPDKSTPLSINELERLPYFEACIKEGLRVMCAAPVRLPRVVGPEGFKFRDYNIPPGTIVSSSPYYRCFDESVYPNPYKFNPDRWLSDDLSKLNSSWLIFHKGSRSCIGQHMALAEMKIFASNFLRNFELDKLVDDIELSERLLGESDNDMRVYLREIS
ncbi:cytochrome P450 [Cadophora sp. DSE1049]|nr:cytochrome P450 [Cadophora sp. DSE1049]